MKKSILFLGFAVVFLSLTSCTTDDLNQDFNDSSVQLEEEMGQDLYQRDSDSIVAPLNNTVVTTAVGDPIVKPKNG